MGAGFTQFEERGETDTGCILATSDEEMGKVGADPPGCGENPARLCYRPRQWGRHKAILFLLSAAREQLDAAFLEEGCAQRLSRGKRLRRIASAFGLRLV